MAKKKSSEEEKKKKEFANTWIVQLDDAEAEVITKRYNEMEQNFVGNEAERISKLSVEEIKAMLQNGTPKAPNKHDFATEIFLLGWDVYSKKK